MSWLVAGGYVDVAMAFGLNTSVRHTAVGSGGGGAGSQLAAGVHRAVSSSAEGGPWSAAGVHVNLAMACCCEWQSVRKGCGCCSALLEPVASAQHKDRIAAKRMHADAAVTSSRWRLLWGVQLLGMQCHPLSDSCTVLLLCACAGCVWLLVRCSEAVLVVVDKRMWHCTCALPQVLTAAAQRALHTDAALASSRWPCADN